MKLWTSVRIANLCAIGFALLVPRLGDAQPPSSRNTTVAAPVKSSALPRTAAAIEAGRLDFLRYGCKFCHGADLKGGVANPNAQGGVVPALVHVSEDYTNEEILNLIRDGRTAPLEKPKGSPPPIYMPQWKKIITDRYIHDILSYLQSKQEKTESW